MGPPTTQCVGKRRALDAREEINTVIIVAFSVPSSQNERVTLYSAGGTPLKGSFLFIPVFFFLVQFSFLNVPYNIANLHSCVPVQFNVIS